METIELHGNVYSGNCPTRQVLDRIGDKWTALVIGVLEEEPKRFSELQRSIGGISQKMLTSTLKALERDGFVERTVFPTVPPGVEYALTPFGRELSAPLMALTRFALENSGRVDEARAAYDRKQVETATELQRASS